jgi:hypothetical protein
MKTGHTLGAKAFVFLVVAAALVPGCTPKGGRFKGAAFGHGPPAKNHPQAPLEDATRPQIEPSASGGPPPLVVDTSAPLLLDEPREGQKAETSGAAAANASCFVCHANYRAEFLVDRHAKAGVGCAHCHGDSLMHKNDENNTTPPETMYAADKIDPFCRGCHTAHDVSPGKVVVRWMERGLDKIDPDELVCTHCHGDHRMKVRTVIWDKTSGELVRTNRGD